MTEDSGSDVAGASKGRLRELTIVIPAYNEQARITRTVERISASVAHALYDLEVIVVDDGSSDATPRILRDLSERLPYLRVIRLERNQGKDAAVKTGISAATRKATLFTDADLPCPLEDLERFWPWYDKGIPIVIGSRRVSGSDIVLPHPPLKRIASFVFNVLTKLLVIRGIRDTQCGFKLLSTAAAKEILPTIRTKGFSFDVEFLVRARQLGFRIREVGVRWSAVPGSKMGLLRHGPRMILQLLELKRLL